MGVLIGRHGGKRLHDCPVHGSRQICFTFDYCGGKKAATSVSMKKLLRIVNQANEPFKVRGFVSFLFSSHSAQPIPGLRRLVP